MDHVGDGPFKPPSLGRGPVKHRLRKKRKKYAVTVPIMTLRTTPEIKLLIREGARQQRRSMTKFIEQLVVDWHAGRV